MIWLYWFLGTLTYFYQFVFRTVFGTLGADVSAKYGLSVTELSTFFAAFMMAYPLMQIPAGILLDKYGPRKMLTIAMALLSIGTFLVSLTTSFSLAIVGRILMGIGSAFCFTGTSKIVTTWFPINMMSFLVGVTIFFGGMGGAFSKQLYQLLPRNWDMSQSLFGLATIGAVIALMIALLLREKRHASVGSAGAAPVKQTNFIQDLKLICTNKQILLSALFTFFAYLPISIIGDSWGPTAFQRIFECSKENADLTLPYFYVAFALGSLFYSTVATVTNKIRWVLIFEFSMAFIFLAILLFFPELGKGESFGIPNFLIYSSIIGFNLGGVALAFPIGCSHVNSEISGTLVGVMNMLCMVSGGMFSKVVGYIVEAYWDGTLSEDGLPVYAGFAYQSALRPLVITTLIAVIIMLFVRTGDELEQQKMNAKEA